MTLPQRHYDLAGQILAVAVEAAARDGVPVLLARDHTALVCGMNLHLITAMVDEPGRPEVQARLDPASGRCCVTLTDGPA